MNHKELVQAVQRETGLPSDKVSAMTDCAVAAIVGMLAQGDSIAIQGFGSFEVKKKEERLSVHPSTGCRMMIPPKQVPSFRPGATLKSRIRNHQNHE